MQKQNAIYILYGLCITLLILGCLQYFEPYLWAQDEERSSMDIWAIENVPQAYFYFKFSSKAMITTNYPVTVEAKIKIENLQLLQTINGREYPSIGIVGTQEHPVTYEEDTGIPFTGRILLTFDGNKTYTGSGQIIFPNLGKNYGYIFYTFTSSNDIIYIHEMNATPAAIENRIPPVFSIEEGYSSRSSFVQASKSAGTSLIAIDIAVIAIVIRLHLELRKKEDTKLMSLINEIKKLIENIEKKHSPTTTNKKRRY